MSGKASANESKVETSLFWGLRVLAAFVGAVAFFSIRETNLAWRATRAAFFVLGLAEEEEVGAAAGAAGRESLVRILARP
jgi:hypothetical protein